MTKRRSGSAVVLWSAPFVVAVLASTPLLAAPQPQAAEIASPEREYMGPDGNPLPFKNDAEVMEYMLNARVVQQTTIGSGINRSQKVMLEKDGVRAHAIFREADVTERDAYVGGRSYRVFRDSFLFEPAAYQLALRIGITNIPPAVRRRVSGRAGSMQGWLEDQLDEEKEAFKPPSYGAWAAQVRDRLARGPTGRGKRSIQAAQLCVGSAQVRDFDSVRQSDIQCRPQRGERTGSL